MLSVLEKVVVDFNFRDVIRRKGLRKGVFAQLLKPICPQVFLLGRVYRIELLHLVNLGWCQLLIIGICMRSIDFVVFRIYYVIAFHPVGSVWILFGDKGYRRQFIRSELSYVILNLLSVFKVWNFSDSFLHLASSCLVWEERIFLDAQIWRMLTGLHT